MQLLTYLGRTKATRYLQYVEKSKLKTYYDRFETHVSLRANPVFARFKVHGRVQGSSETAEEFITDLRILAQDCDFKDPDEMIRYRIVFGTNSPKVREKVISKGSTQTRDKAVELATSFEASQAQLSAMAGSSTNNSEETVNLVQKQNTGKGPQGTQPSNFCLVLFFFFAAGHQQTIFFIH